MMEYIPLPAARPCMLPDETWGVWVEGDVKPGDMVHVTANSGKEWRAILHEQIDGNKWNVKPRSRKRQKK